MYHFRFFLLLLLLTTFAHVMPGQVLIRNLVSIDVKPQDPYLDRRTRFGMSRAFQLFEDDISSTDPAACSNAASFPQRMRWNPSRNGNKFINYDEFYAQMPQRNLAVLHGAAPFMVGGLFGKPLCTTAFNNESAHSLPQSYLLNTIRASLFAARYGSAPAAGFPPNFGQVASQYVETPDNQIANGNNTVNSIEVFNEADNAWADGLPTTPTNLADVSVSGIATPTKYYFTPAQYAAILSAAYDGNAKSADFHFKDANGNNISGPDAFWGIKNLSPSTQVVMAGTADLRRAWIDGVVSACNNIRPAGAHLPFDVVNYHFYSTTGHPAINTSDWALLYDGKSYTLGAGEYPEATKIKLKERFTKVLNEQNAAIQSLPTWITEFGYSDAAGPTTQGQWLTRYILETSAVRTNNRGIDRLFIYDLNDDGSGNSGGYATHGLQKADGTPKKSWYHVMTMMNVLGNYSYVRNNASPSPTATLEQFFINNGPVAAAADDPRIYLYGNPGGVIYALWVPNGTGMTYPGKLKLVGNWQTKPRFQKIEVLEYDEDGKRTMIPDAEVTGFIPATPGVANSAVVYINNMTLTETPLYLREASIITSDPAVPPVNNLVASCLGCQRTQLSWTNPLNSHYTFIRVYYAKASEYGASPEIFDLSRVHLYNEQLTGGATSIYMDLPVDYYYFWVIPFTTPYDLLSQQHLMVSPDLQGTLSPASSYYVKFNPGTCAEAPCVAPLTQSNITNLLITRPDGSVMNQFGNSYFTNGFYEALIPTNLNTICGEMNGSIVPPSPGISLDPNSPNTGIRVSFVVNFPTPQYLRAIQIYLYGGRAQLQIEFMEDCCSAYYLVKQYNFGGNTPQWLTLNNSSPNKRIEKVRITIIAAEIAGAGVSLSRLLFCTAPAFDRCYSGGQTSATVNAVAPGNLQVTNIDTHSAVVSFSPATRTVLGETVGEEPVYLHTLRYGIALDALGEIVQPQEIKIYGGEYGKDVEKALGKLASNTTYIVDVLATVACNDKDNVVSRITFTTAKENKDRTGPTAAAVDDIRLYPNPVGDILHMDIPAGKYAFWRILSLNGNLLQSGTIGFEDRSLNIHVPDLPPGIHVASLFSADGKTWSKGFLKAE